ncbi:MAG: O-methyltransferase [Acidimicrobiales bacterium]
MADVRALRVTGELVDYAVAHGSWPEDPVLSDLRDETTALGPVAGMQIGPDQGQLLTLFARLVGAKRAVELGTFTGYSSLCIARGLATDGTLLCCDVNAEWTAMARKAWERAGVAERIELRIAPAIETLRSLPTVPTVDLAFVDADKGGYWDYWDELVPRVRSGGVLLADNVLWSGRVADDDGDEDTRAIREFNDRVAVDDRVDVVVLPAFDGLTIALRR